MKKIILTIFCFGMLFPLLGSAARPYGVEEIPNVQVGNRYRFTSNPDGVLSPSAVAEIDSLCYSLRHRALAQVAVVAVEDIRGDDLSPSPIRFFPMGCRPRRFGQRTGHSLGRRSPGSAVRDRTGTGRRLARCTLQADPDALHAAVFPGGDYSAGMVAGLRAVASVLEGSELDSGGNDDFRAADDLPVWAVFLIVFLVVLVPLGIMLVGFYHSRRCPRCRAFALVLQSRNLVGQTDHYNLFEDTYRCGKCGFVVKRQSRSARSDNNNHRGGGVCGSEVSAADTVRAAASVEVSAAAASVAAVPVPVGKFGNSLKNDRKNEKSYLDRSGRTCGAVHQRLLFGL